MNAKYEPLFESLTLPCGAELRNRIVMAPMTHSSSNEDDTVSDGETAYYARRAGGVGMLITACTYVSRNGKGFPRQFAGYSDAYLPGFRRLASTIKAGGAKAVLQLYHGGRLCQPRLLPNEDLVSAGAVPSERTDARTPRALEEDEIQAIIRDYAEAARRAIEAGFDGVEIHGANGYLIQQFFSPHSNRREDRWGGSREKRMAFPLEVIRAIRETVDRYAESPFIVGYRFSPEEPETPGITMEDTFALLDALKQQPLDYLHVSLNDFWSAPRRGADSSRTRIAHILERVGGKLPVIGVGGIATADEALKAKEAGVALVALGKELVIEPDWAQKVERGEEEAIRTKIRRDAQADLVVPDPFWHSIVNSNGWFPVE